jgi:hypothetical protein
VLAGLWNRFVGALGTSRAEREAARESPESPAERSRGRERFGDGQSDLVVEERLGGVDPGRLLDDERGTGL